MIWRWKAGQRKAILESGDGVRYGQGRLWEEGERPSGRGWAKNVLWVLGSHSLGDGRGCSHILHYMVHDAMN